MCPMRKYGHSAILLFEIAEAKNDPKSAYAAMHAGFDTLQLTLRLGYDAPARHAVAATSLGFSEMTRFSIASSNASSSSLLSASSSSSCSLAPASWSSGGSSSKSSYDIRRLSELWVGRC